MYSKHRNSKRVRAIVKRIPVPKAPFWVWETMLDRLSHRFEKDGLLKDEQSRSRGVNHDAAVGERPAPRQPKPHGTATDRV
ncbi:MAG: hypothetical protein AB2598_07835 [Candidatus Thiodiazotropha sp.]